MEIRDWATSLLSATTLDDKLCLPSELTDRRPGEVSGVPAFPARPDSLRPTGERMPFPTASQANDPLRRGEVLHFFANHELLALELMALMLLRFPDAPPAFRRGLVHTITEEQQHLGLYLHRMGELGVKPGRVPVNRFFWDCLAQTPSLAHFLAGMSLTFEAANLDHSLMWAGHFEQMGDAATAELMMRVYRDEVGHVRSGVHWFDRLHGEAGRDRFTVWSAHLSGRLSPARARGSVFDQAGREAAGLDAAFCDRVRLFRRSKGRVPDVWSFEPDIEERMAAGDGYSPSKVARTVTADLQTLPALLARPGDVVLVDAAPPVDWLAQLDAAGFDLPEFATAEQLTGRRVGQHRPWGPDVAPELYSKAFVLPWRPEVRLCTSAAQVHEALDSVLSAHSDALVKAPWSTSGRHRRSVRRGAQDPAFGPWLDGALRRQGSVLVEPRYDRVLDLSVQLTVGANRIRVDGIVRFATDPQGRFVGAWCGPVDRGLPAPLRRFVAGDGDAARSVPARLKQVAQQVGDALRSRGFRGPAGIDAMVVRAADGLALVPIVELNPRNTMGRVALGLRGRVAPGRHAWWGFVDKARLAELPRVAVELQHGRIVAGSIDTTPQATASRLCTRLFVSDRAMDFAPSW